MRIDETVDLVDNMDIDKMLEEPADDGSQPGALVAVWITNSYHSRQAVVGKYGLFEKWHVEFVEEWVWVKVTTSGEPVCPADGKYRLPWEVCLMGRRMKEPKTIDEINAAAAASCGKYRQIKRRFIIAVPDVHSRKPCLKSLVEPLLQKDYRALECFARYLVEGWWSWGDEAIKFSWEGHRVPMRPAEDYGELKRKRKKGKHKRLNRDQRKENESKEGQSKIMETEEDQNTEGEILGEATENEMIGDEATENEVMEDVIME
ncbi:MT-A70-domain-containing protein [Lineolata rhizophorae]|uniref:MT-A70-domain-containing protein n=1 Tax=Lineolata rhizophorae TaxID=578093 RepID=A0A6A6PCM8_9PEZI|nr:MT-A70-domain-containing protein [Lineolata rhizophorae]